MADEQFGHIAGRATGVVLGDFTDQEASGGGGEMRAHRAEHPGIGDQDQFVHAGGGNAVELRRRVARKVVLLLLVIIGSFTGAPARSGAFEPTPGTIGAQFGGVGRRIVGAFDQFEFGGEF